MKNTPNSTIVLRAFEHTDKPATVKCYITSGIRIQEGTLTFCLEAFQHSGDSVCKWGDEIHSGPRDEEHGTGTRCPLLIELCPPLYPPPLSLLHERVYHMYAWHAPATPGLWEKHAQQGSVRSTAGFLHSFNPSLQCQFVFLQREFEANLISVSFHVSVYVPLPLLTVHSFVYPALIQVEGSMSLLKIWFALHHAPFGPHTPMATDISKLISCSSPFFYSACYLTWIPVKMGFSLLLTGHLQSSHWHKSLQTTSA